LSRDTSCRVLTVFRHSFYLQSITGGLICVGPLAMGPGPLNALYRFPLALNWRDIGLGEDTPASFDGRTLTVGDRFVFDVLGALKWRPPAVGRYRRPDAIAGGLAFLKISAIRHAPQDSLGYFIPLLVERRVMENQAPPMTAFQRACLDAAGHLTDWLGERFSGRADQRPSCGIQSLLGLGPGLTPLGDDLLGGAMLAMHSLGRADLAQVLWDWLRAAAQQRTNKISLAHLSWAARGSGAEMIHQTISALMLNDTDRLADSLKAVGRIGHTSGWDTLAGVALVWQSYLDHHYCEHGSC